MVVFRVYIQVLFVMDRLYQVQLFVADWVAIVVLHRLNDIHKPYLRVCPVVIVLHVLVHGLWNVVMIRDPVIFRLVLFLSSLGSRVLPVVLVELMVWLVCISMHGIVVHKILKHILVSVLFMGGACFNELMHCLWVQEVGGNVIFFRSLFAIVSVFQM